MFVFNMIFSLINYQSNQMMNLITSVISYNNFILIDLFTNYLNCTFIFVEVYVAIMITMLMRTIRILIFFYIYY